MSESEWQRLCADPIAAMEYQASVIVARPAAHWEAGNPIAEGLRRWAWLVIRLAR